MAVTGVVEEIRKLADGVARSYGLDVFDVQYRREAPGMVLRVQIDRPGSGATAEEPVSVEDCARVSRDLSALLDVEDVLPAAYTLEVSSPGLDRPLRYADDYRRFTGRQAKIVVREPIDGQGFFRGRLGGMDGNEVVLEGQGGRQYRIPLDAIARAQLEVEF